MEHLLLEYFRDKPAIVNAYFRYKVISMNIALLCILCTAILAKTELVRSFSLGIAAGIVIITLGQSINSLRDKGSANKSVNG